MWYMLITQKEKDLPMSGRVNISGDEFTAKEMAIMIEASSNALVVLDNAAKSIGKKVRTFHYDNLEDAYVPYQIRISTRGRTNEN
jgi:hypothetical protein